LSCTSEEARIVRDMADERDQTIQGYLMGLVLHAAARSRRAARAKTNDQKEE